MSTKVQTVNGGFTELRISGLTVQPSPGNIAMALNMLENMMSELFTIWDLNIGYNFEASPGINSQTNVPRAFQGMMEKNLACRLIPAFNKQVPPQLEKQASGALNGAISYSAKINMRPIQPSSRMPVGSGNTVRGQYWSRYSVPDQLPPNDAPTNYILQGERFTYTEDFSAWLGLNTIASYTIVCDPLLTIVTSANATPVITYTITAPAGETGGTWQFVKITVTDSAGRIDIRLINFGVATPPTVPAP